MKWGKPLDTRPSDTIMVDDEEIPEWISNNPTEVNAIGGSIAGYFLIFKVIGADWFWHQSMECGFWNGENCGGTEWWPMLYLTILTVVLAPGIWGGITIFIKKKFTHLEKARRDKFVGLSMGVVSASVFWAILWLWSLPHTWGMMPFGQSEWWGFPGLWIIVLLPIAISAALTGLYGLNEELKKFASEEEDVKKVETDFKAKLASSTDEGNKFEIKKEKSLDPTKQPLTKEQEFTSILGDMSIHEKYKK